MSQTVKTRLMHSFFTYVTLLIPVYQLALVLNVTRRSEHESPARTADAEYLAEVRMNNVIVKLVVTGVGLALSAFLRHLAMTKLKKIPSTL